MWISTPTAEREKEAKEEQAARKPMDNLTLLIVIVLTVLLATVVALSVIPLE